MPTREQIKERAKLTLRANYGVSVLAFLLVGLLAYASAYLVVGSIFVAIPLSLGLMCFCLVIYQGGKANIADLFNTGFCINYLRKIGGMLWMGLFTWLWSLLFVIPGIIKAFSYAMTPYILAAYPDVKAKDALKLSMRIMNGHKAELFVLGLSFLGWELLSAFTCGLLTFLYVGPYMQITMTGYYCELLDYAVKCGIVTPDELNGAPIM